MFSFQTHCYTSCEKIIGVRQTTATTKKERKDYTLQYNTSFVYKIDFCMSDARIQHEKFQKSHNKLLGGFKIFSMYRRVWFDR